MKKALKSGGKDAKNAPFQAAKRTLKKKKRPGKKDRKDAEKKRLFLCVFFFEIGLKILCSI